MSTNRRHLTIRSTAATAAAALVVATGGLEPANAADDFGSHVVDCAQDPGFNGEHNPGMHRGYAGWDPTHVC